jgi:serine/threonine protein phosphatase PrpC
MWKINSAMIIGRDHEYSKKNRQDFCIVKSKAQRTVGIVCDGCGESKYSEVGSALFGNVLLNELLEVPLTNEDTLKININTKLMSFLDIIKLVLGAYTTEEEINLIADYFLTTFIFCIIDDSNVWIGYCGDGVIITDNKIQSINQSGKPHYFAYNAIPKNVLEQEPSELDGIKIECIPIEVINKIIIATDGLQPLIDKQRVEELFGNTGRQLQRKFNVIQQIEKLLYDDTACIVFEKE